MINLTDLARGKLRDPLLMEWALDRYRDAKSRDEGEADRLADAWFDELTLHHWVREGDADLLPTLLRKLPSRRLARIAASLAERWPSWKGAGAAAGARVLARLLPERAAELFSSAFGAGTCDLNTMHAMIESLPDLPATPALELLSRIAKEVGDTLEDDFARRLFGVPVLNALLRLAPERAGDWFDDLVRIACDADDLESMLCYSARELFGQSDLFELAADRLGTDSAVPLEALRVLFRPEAPFDEAERVLDAERPSAVAQEFLSGQEGSGPTLVALRAALGSRLRTETEENANLLAGFTFALSLHTHLAETPDLSELGLAETLELAGCDCRSLSPIPAISAHLAGFDRDAVIQGLVQGWQEAQGHSRRTRWRSMGSSPWPISRRTQATRPRRFASCNSPWKPRTAGGSTAPRG